VNRVCYHQPPRSGFDYQVRYSGVASSQATSCQLVWHVDPPCRGDTSAAPVYSFAAIQAHNDSPTGCPGDTERTERTF